MQNLISNVIGAILEPSEAPEPSYWQKTDVFMYKSISGNSDWNVTNNGGKFKYLNLMIQITPLCSFPKKQLILIITQITPKIPTSHGKWTRVNDLIPQFLIFEFPAFLWLHSSLKVPA